MTLRIHCCEGFCRAIPIWEQIQGPREMWVLEDDFHSPPAIEGLGGEDVYYYMADFLRDAFDKKLHLDEDRELYREPTEDNETDVLTKHRRGPDRQSWEKAVAMINAMFDSYEKFRRQVQSPADCGVMHHADGAARTL